MQQRNRFRNDQCQPTSKTIHQNDIEHFKKKPSLDRKKKKKIDIIAYEQRWIGSIAANFRYN